MSERKSRPPQRGVWYAKTETNTNRQQPSIQKLLELVGNIYIFFREEDRNLFTFAGMGTAAEVFDETPVKIIWRFHGGEGTRLPTQLPEEIDEYEAATVSEAARLVDWSIGRLVDFALCCRLNSLASTVDKPQMLPEEWAALPELPYRAYDQPDTLARFPTPSPWPHPHSSKASKLNASNMGQLVVA